MTVKLTGENGNAFAIMGRVVLGLRAAGIDDAAIEAYRTAATSGDYDNLLSESIKVLEDNGVAYT